MTAYAPRCAVSDASVYRVNLAHSAPGAHSVSDAQGGAGGGLSPVAAASARAQAATTLPMGASNWTAEARLSGAKQ